MPCMNCTSAGDAGGSLPLVVDGRVFVGLPGAPGWTTTGGFESACGAKGAKENALASEVPDISMPAHVATLNTTRIPWLVLLYRDRACRKYLTIVGLTISRRELHIQRGLHEFGG